MNPEIIAPGEAFPETGDPRERSPETGDSREASPPDEEIPREVSPRQAAVAYAMVRGSKRFDEVMADFGVNTDELVRWIREGRFTSYAMRLAHGFAQADAPYVWQALLKAAEEGSVPATRLYFDLVTKASEGPKPSLPSLPVSAEISALRASVFGGEDGA